jgi:hypothetical protein
MHSIFPNVERTVFVAVACRFSTDMHPIAADDIERRDKIASYLFHRMTWLVSQWETVMDFEVEEAVHVALAFDTDMCEQWLRDHVDQIQFTYDSENNNRTPLIGLLLSYDEYALVAKLPSMWWREGLDATRSFDAAFLWIGDMRDADGLVDYIYACSEYGWDIHRIKLVYDVSDDNTNESKVFWTMWYFMYAASHTTARVHFRRTKDGSLLVWSSTGFSLHIVGCSDQTLTHPVTSWISTMCLHAVSVQGCVIARDIGSTYFYHDALCRDIVSPYMLSRFYTPMPLDLCDNNRVLREIRHCRLLSQHACQSSVPCRYIGFRYPQWISVAAVMIIGIECGHEFLPLEMIYRILHYLSININMLSFCHQRVAALRDTRRYLYTM